MEFNFSEKGSKRSIFLFDVVESENANDIISSLIEMNKLSEVEPINLFINSPGGDTYAMFGIIDTMNMIKAPVNTFVIGIAASAAAGIASSGKKRYVTQNARIMIHEAATRIAGKTSVLEDNIEELKDVQTKYFEILSRTSNQSVKEIEKITEKKDYFMNAEESIKFGLSDEILTEEQFAVVKLSEAVSTDNIEIGQDFKTIHLLQVGEHKTSNYNSLVVTEEMIKVMKENFDNNVYGQEINISYTHDNDNGEKKAGAWIKELFIKDEGLYAKVEYTPTAEGMIENKEYKYVSAEFVLNYRKPGTEQPIPYVLMGGSFTNRPRVKGLETLKLSENENEDIMDLVAMKGELKKTHNIDVEALLGINNEVKQLKVINTKLLEEKGALESEKETLETEKKEAVEGKEAVETELNNLKQETVNKEKEIEVTNLIDNGIILVAHKERILNQFQDAQAIQDFYKDAPAVLNVKAKGKDGNDENGIEDKKIENLSKESRFTKEDFKKYGKMVKMINY